MKRALITGITGQDGSYLAEFLLDKGYEVHGLVRWASSFNRARIDHLPRERLSLHYGDLIDTASLIRVIEKAEPDEVYNLAAQSHVRVSFDLPEHTGDVTALGALRILEAMRESGSSARFYQASSSEMFGQAREIPQRETTPFHPRSPYAAAKVFAFWAAVNYRESYGLFAANGILFNHESPRRGESFVTRKITSAVARIEAGLESSVSLGNLEARRDWGYAREYVEAMWLMLQQPSPDDYVVATGETHSVRDFLEEAFAYAGLDWKEYVRIDPRYFRPAEVDVLVGDATRARERLGWTPRTRFADLVRLMVDADRELVRAGAR